MTKAVLPTRGIPSIAALVRRRASMVAPEMPGQLPRPVILALVILALVILVLVILVLVILDRARAMAGRRLPRIREPLM